MFKTLLAGLAFILLAAGQTLAAPPLSVFGQLPAIEDMVLSPDGETIAFVAVDGDKRRVLVETVSGKTLQTLSLGKMKTRLLIWAGNDHLIILVGTTLHRRSTDRYEYEMMSAVSLNTKTGKTLELFTKHTSAFGNITGYFGGAEIDGHRVGYFRSQEHGGAGLYRVDLDDGSAVQVSAYDAHAHDWVLDDHGRIVARSAFNPATNIWSLYDGPSGDHVVFSKTTKVSDLHLVGLGRTANSVLIEDESGDEDAVLEVPLFGAKPQTLFANMKVSREFFAPEWEVLLGAMDSQRDKAAFFDPLLQARFDAARKPFAKYYVTLTSYDAAFDRLILFTEGADDAGTYWFVDMTSGKANALAQAYPDIAAADVAPTSLVLYKAGDGLEIEAVLTLPPQHKPGPLPFVMLPHGGPIGPSDHIRFDWWAQAFASEGYVVLQPNFRGSGGYGAAFRRAGFGQWGRKMQSDLSDGVAFLASQGIIDPRRGCIVGGSYGGYAALAGVTLQHGLYRCAVSYGGVSDLGAMMWRAGYNQHFSLASRWEERAMGASWSGDASLAARSPVHQASQADAPILLIHGKDDTVVPITESENMDAALSRAGKPHAFIKLDSEDHWLSSPETRTQMLSAAVAFVMAHNPPS